MIKRECVDEERWVDEETFKKTLAVYQVLPGPEAHELCVYFGRIRGGKLGGFLAGLGFMLPGFLLMLGALDPLRRGRARRQPRRALLRAQGGGRRDRRPGARPAEPVVHHRCPAGAARGRGLRAHRVRRPRASCSSCSAPGSLYELWTNARAGRRPHSSRSACPAILAVLAGAVTLSLTAEIFWEGLKAGLVTFGGAFTVIPFLQDVAVEATALAHRRASSSTASRSAACCPRR